MRGTLERVTLPLSKGAEMLSMDYILVMTADNRFYWARSLGGWIAAVCLSAGIQIT